MHLKSLHLIIIYLLWLLFSPSMAFATDISVYVPSFTKAHVVEKKLTSFCPNITFTAFGRGRDFINNITQKQPTAILSLTMVVTQHTNYNTIIQGQIANNSTEPMLLISADKPLTMPQLKQSSIGIINYLGRKKMSQHVTTQLGEKTQLKLVYNISDLFSLLTFNAAQGILIPSSIFNTFAQQSKRKLITNQINFNFGLARIATATKDTKLTETLFTCITNLDQSANEMLGVEQWVIY